MKRLFLALTLLMMTQLCWTQSSITLENEDAQLVLNKLRMGEYYENMFHLNTERIAVLEALVQNKDEELSELRMLNEVLEERVLISKEELKTLEKRYKGAEKDWSKKNIKTGVVIGLIFLSLGVLMGAGAF